ncbi:MAG: HAD family hydrolase [Lachnospiraceae bacterium]|nr:HAD family hydrolase [Lachnospiraceae bacterium]
MPALKKGRPATAFLSESEAFPLNDSRCPQIKIIVTDLDNTLLHSSDYSDRYITDYTVSVLNKCREAGIKTAFATARSTKAAARFFEMFTPDIFIGYGGALTLIGDKIINKFEIPAKVSNRLIKDCLSEPEVYSVYATTEAISMTNIPGLMEGDLSHYQYSDFKEETDFPYLKISFEAENPEVMERIAKNYPMCDLLRYSGEDLYRFADINAVKWNAVKAVAGYLEISTENMVAFGDDINDLEMIKNCGIGVAVKNAIAEVKDAADFICGTNDNDGVAKWLAENILASGKCNG